MRAALMTTAAAVLAMASCGHDFPPGDARIRPAGEFTGAGLVYQDAASGLPYTVGDLNICLDRSGHVTIDRIELVEPFGDISLDDFTVIPNVMETGAEGFADNNLTIAEQGLPTGKPVVLDKPCPADTLTPSPTNTPQAVALILEYSKNGDTSAGNHGITIHYTSRGNQHWVSIPWEILLCAPRDEVTDKCDTS